MFVSFAILAVKFFSLHPGSTENFFPRISLVAVKNFLSSDSADSGEKFSVAVQVFFSSEFLFTA